MYKLLSNNSCSLFKAFCKCLGGDHDHDHHDHPKTHDQQTDANSTSEAERQMKITEEENGSLARSPPKPPISSRVGDQINGEEDGSLARSPPKPPISSRVGDQINVNFSVSIAHAECCTPANQVLTPHPTHPTQPLNSPSNSTDHPKPAYQKTTVRSKIGANVKRRRRRQRRTCSDEGDDTATAMRTGGFPRNPPVRVAFVAARPASPSPSPCRCLRRCTSIVAVAVAVVASRRRRRRLLVGWVGLGGLLSWMAELSG
ncbi:hypothetical protein LWI29_018342 [Acer saccharum]|uniref:Uncharacterized protein n=1 Tax=Acer saccharum TaxID=4024 RepID=A0AA39TT58_ACESA|nr:hypothetical protein LWI29_018342 [Acer saccharum]